VLYTDIDGTLVGPGGDLLSTGGHEPTRVAVDALLDARRAGLEIVPLSGRDIVRVDELGRLLGLSSWIAELGGVRAYERGTRRVVDTGAYPGSGSPVEALYPALGELVARWPGRVEPHDPWNDGRLVSLMVRGELDLDAAHAGLVDAGYGWAEIVDNGVIPRRYESLPEVTTVRAYHVAPRGISKRDAVVADRDARGIPRERCAVIGDAAADLACHDVVARCFVVRNALDKDPSFAADVAAVPNATVTRHGHGEGFAEVVGMLLDAH
jgi:hydroxymethylpyrimidine pyrophosphatase-like HAD family hydrolase